MSAPGARPSCCSKSGPLVEAGVVVPTIANCRQLWATRANLGHPIVGLGLILRGFGFELVDAAVVGGGQLDGVEQLAGDVIFELARAEGVEDVGEGDAQSVGAVE